MSLRSIVSHPAPKNPAAFSESITETPFSAKEELAHLGEILRQEIRNSVAELQATQIAAATAQSEVLRTLTEVIFQSSGSRDISPESLERAFSGVEDRLIARIEAATRSLLSAESSSSGTTTKPASGSPASPGPMKLKVAASSVTHSWEQIRNEMLTRQDLSDTPGKKQDGEVAQLQEVTQLSSDQHFRLPEQDPSLEIPQAVDPESLSDPELRDAFREREGFISTLISRIRRQQELATGQLSSEQLRTLVTELPSELASQVKHTLKQMDDLARMGELELSLERARIARQVNQLEHSRGIIEHNARQLGLNLSPDGTVSTPANQQCRTSSSRRWLGKLGFGQ